MKIVAIEKRAIRRRDDRFYALGEQDIPIKVTRGKASPPMTARLDIKVNKEN